MTSSVGDPLPGPAVAGLLSPVTVDTAAESLTGDQAVVAAMVRAETALLRALADTGIAPAEPVRRAAEHLDGYVVPALQLAHASTSGGNPVIPLVGLLREAVGADMAAWVHHGATSQDILDTALMLVADDVQRRVEADLVRLSQTLAELARSLRDVPAVARTLSQQALPTTMGFRAAGWLTGVHDALRVLRALRLPASLGGPVGTAAAYGERGRDVLAAYADRLGLALEPVSWHTRRTPVLAVAHAATVTGGACGTLAADVVQLAQTEVGEVREAVGGGSSSMPHKANPAQAVLVLAGAQQIPALAATLGVSAVAGTERPPGPWHAEWQPLRQILCLAGAAAQRTAALAEGLVFDHDAIRSHVEDLRDRLGENDAWVDRHVQAALPWVDHVLHAHEEALRS